MTISSARTGVNHTKKVASLTVAQRDALLRMMGETKDKKAPKQPEHTQSVTPIYFKNVSGVVIPPYACMQVTGTEEYNGQNYLQCDRIQDATGAAGWYLFNSHCEVEVDGRGLGHDGVLVRSKVQGALKAGDKASPKPNSFAVVKGDLFPVAGEDDIDSDIIRIFTGGGGGGGLEVMFSIAEVYGTETAESELCADKLKDAKDRYKATCVKVSCGSGAPLTDEDGYFEVVDYLGFLEGREEADVIGKTGLASYMGDCDGYEDCEWVITWIDWFRERTVMTGFTMSDTSLCFKFENVKVWDHCKLPDECIALTDCEEY